MFHLNNRTIQKHVKTKWDKQKTEFEFRVPLRSSIKKQSVENLILRVFYTRIF